MIYNYIKFFKIFFIFIIIIFIEKKIIKEFNKKKIFFNNLFFGFNLTENNSIKYKIKIGIYCKSIKNGGIERLTSLLINYLSKPKIFKIFLFTKKKENNEYLIAKNTKRIIIKFGLIKYLIKSLIKNSIDILIYQHYNYKEIKILNSISNFKTIFYNHSCFLYWIYSGKYKTFINLYDAYKNSKYVISLVPFENDFLFNHIFFLINQYEKYFYLLFIVGKLKNGELTPY